MYVQVSADKLVRAAFLEMGISIEEPLAFAKRVELVGDSRAKRVTRWRDGVAAPEYEPTLRILQEAGWLDEAKLRRALTRLEAKEAEEAARAAAEGPLGGAPKRSRRGRETG
jgi:hypothetical protein